MNDRSVSPFRKIDYPENNLLINSAFDYWQRGTSGFTTPNVYTADRWRTNYSHTAAISIDRDTDIPNDLSFQTDYSLKYTVTTGAATGAAEWSLIEQKMEGVVFEEAIGKYVTVSFWVKSNVTGTMSCSLMSESSNNYRYTFEFNINQADTWERKHKTVFIDSAVPFGSGTSKSCTLFFNLGVGSNHHATSLDQWVSDSSWSSVDCVDFMATTSNYLKIAGAMISEGSKLIPFTRRGFDLENEKALCFRYFQIEYEGGYTKAIGRMIGTTQARLVYPSPVRMRANPTPSFHSTIDTYPHSLASYSGSTVSVTSAFTLGAGLITVGNGMNLLISGTIGFAANSVVTFNPYSGGQGAYIAFDAEL